MDIALAVNSGSTQPSSDSSPTEPDLPSIEKRRNAFRNKLTPQHYRALSGIITDAIGSAIARVFGLKTPVSFWISAALIAVLTFLIGLAISWVRGENLQPLQVQFSAWAAIMGTLVLVVNKVMIDIFLNTFRGRPLDAIASEKDLADLEKWLDQNFGYKMPLIASLIFGTILGVILYTQWDQASGQEVLLVGPLFITIIASILAIVAIYYIFPFYILLPGRLSGYRFNLFMADPSSSEVAKRLSDMFTLIMYMTTGYIVLITASFAYFKVLTPTTTVLLVIFVWVPTVGLYVGSQFSLSRIITNSKWGTLYGIQTNIESLMTGAEAPNVKALEHIEKLLDYHDRIHNTPDSVLQFRAVLNFLNSLLLPLITLILANWNAINDFYQTVVKNLFQKAP